MSGILSGVRVLELAQWVFVPSAGALLADLGADVVKVEHPRQGDPARGLRKAGWLLPLPSPEGGREGEPAESNYDWREALYAPPTTELAFDLVVPPGARLRLATSLARETPPGAAARFQVELSGLLARTAAPVDAEGAGRQPQEGAPLDHHARRHLGALADPELLALLAHGLPVQWAS